MLSIIQCYLRPTYELSLRDGMVFLRHSLYGSLPSAPYGWGYEVARGPDVPGLWYKIIELICKFEVHNTQSLVVVVTDAIKFAGGVGSFTHGRMLYPRRQLYSFPIFYHNAVNHTPERAKNYLTTEFIGSKPTNNFPPVSLLGERLETLARLTEQIDAIANSVFLPTDDLNLPELSTPLDDILPPIPLPELPLAPPDDEYFNLPPIPEIPIASTDDVPYFDPYLPEIPLAPPDDEDFNLALPLPEIPLAPPDDVPDLGFIDLIDLPLAPLDDDIPELPPDDLVAYIDEIGFRFRPVCLARGWRL